MTIDPVVLVLCAIMAAYLVAILMYAVWDIWAIMRRHRQELAELRRWRAAHRKRQKDNA